MRHVHPVPRQDAIRWLGRAISVIGLLALLVLPLGGPGSSAAFHYHLLGVGQLEKALPAELRTGRPAAVSTDKAPAGPTPTLAAAADPQTPRSSSDCTVERPPTVPRVARPLFLRPASQAPPVTI